MQRCVGMKKKTKPKKQCIFVFHFLPQTPRMTTRYYGYWITSGWESQSSSSKSDIINTPESMHSSSQLHMKSKKSPQMWVCWYVSCSVTSHVHLVCLSFFNIRAVTVIRSYSAFGCTLTQELFSEFFFFFKPYILHVLLYPSTPIKGFSWQWHKEMKSCRTSVDQVRLIHQKLEYQHHPVHFVQCF